MDSILLLATVGAGQKNSSPQQLLLLKIASKVLTLKNSLKLFEMPFFLRENYKYDIFGLTPSVSFRMIIMTGRQRPLRCPRFTQIPISQSLPVAQRALLKDAFLRSDHY